MLHLPSEWDGVWFMALAAVALVAAETAAVSGPERAPLPAALALLALTLLAPTLRSREAAHALATTTALLATTVAALWAAGAPTVWDVYPPLLLGALIAGGQRRWG